MILNTKVLWTFAAVMLVLLVTPGIMAEPSFVYSVDEAVDIKIPVFNSDNSKATSVTNCAITIKYPNETIVVNDQNMTFNNSGYYNYTVSSNLISVSGEYPTTMRCDDSSDYGFTTFSFLINPPGIFPTDQRTNSITRSIYVVFFVAIVFFLAFMFTEKPPIKWTWFIFSFIFFLTALNLISLTLVDEVVNPTLTTFFDGFTAIYWVLFWFAAGFLAFLWMFTFLNTIIMKQNERNLAKFE